MEVEYTSLNHIDLTEQTYKVLRGKILRRQLIGLSLPPDYLANSPTMGTAASIWQNAFGSAAFSLKELHEAGITSIELRSLYKDTDPDLALCAARRVLDAGMDLTIHGHLPGPILGETFAELYPPLVPLVKALREGECESVMTQTCSLFPTWSTWRRIRRYMTWLRSSWIRCSSP